MAASNALVEQWDLHELSLEGPSTGNPFVDVELTARFTLGEDCVSAQGFYDGDGVYRVRFMPPRQGRWRYETISNRRELHSKSGDFLCVAPAAGNHGPVRVAH